MQGARRPVVKATPVRGMPIAQSTGMKTSFPMSFVVAALVSSAAVAAFAQAQQPSRPATSQPTASDPELAALVELLPMLDDKARRGLALQVALDRAGFSPGEIDAAPGANTDRAMAAYKATKGDGELGEYYTTPVVPYTITAEDAAGPFVADIPEDMMEKAKLSSLTYASVLEMLSERFHASPKLLQRLNPQAKFSSGESILVPNVEPFVLSSVEQAAKPGTAKQDTAKQSNAKDNAKQSDVKAGDTTQSKQSAMKPDNSLTVTVTDRTKTLEVKNAAGEIVFHAPVTTGSERDPLPLGEWKVNGVGRNPHFNYNPDLFWDADPSHAKAKLPAGPNNPVGVVWIDLDKEHYGIHGTPEPSRIGYTESHGCIRLTNWDAARLADLVAPGTKVVLR
jgi:lipoprotein-anchoring transpeptidase ErfK/SrfK